MNNWIDRPLEERALLNPSFCGCLLWKAALGYAQVLQNPLPFDLAFLVLPMALHKDTRDSLPSSVVTSIPVWLEDNSLARSRIASRARMMVPYTKEAMVFAGRHQLISFRRANIEADPSWIRTVNNEFNISSHEVKVCLKRAEFLGKWFAKAGSPETLMALLGVRP